MDNIDTSTSRFTRNTSDLDNEFTLSRDVRPSYTSESSEVSSYTSESSEVAPPYKFNAERHVHFTLPYETDLSPYQDIYDCGHEDLVESVEETNMNYKILFVLVLFVVLLVTLFSTYFILIEVAF